jgi:hypothetical protein
MGYKMPHDSGRSVRCPQHNLYLRNHYTTNGPPVCSLALLAGCLLSIIQEMSRERRDNRVGGNSSLLVSVLELSL